MEEISDEKLSRAMKAAGKTIRRPTKIKKSKRRPLMALQCGHNTNGGCCGGVSTKT